MRYDYLREPISDSQPCGPDLDLEMDADYTNYMLLASGRLPSRFFDNDGNPFDQQSIDLDAEVKAISGFLERSRDARLLILDMRFQALRGELTGFSEAAQGLAILVTDFWNDFHPQPEDGDLVFRMNAVEAIDDQVQIVLPLQFASLSGPGRSSSVSLRNYLVATGASEARGGEERMSVDSIGQLLGGERQAEYVVKSHAAIETALAALGEIRNAFLSNAPGSPAPSFERVVDVLKQMDGLIKTYRPDLAPAAAEEPDEEGDEGNADGAAPRRSAVPAGLIKTHRAATSALEAIESYFLRREPSNPALVLVHQSRILIGRPLVEALQALMPEPSERVALRFDSGISFNIDFGRMREVTEAAMQNGVPDDPAEPEPSAAADGGQGPEESAIDESARVDDAINGADDGEAAADGAEAAEAGSTDDAAPAPTQDATVDAPKTAAGPLEFSVRTRDDASDLMQATEAFFKTAEPSSPVPLLLAKARNYLNKDFAAIVGDLLPKG